MLSLPERKLAIQWHNEEKSQEEIAQLLDCHQSSVSRLIAKQHKHKTIRNLPRTGKPTKLKDLSRLRSKIKQVIEQKNKSFGSISTKELRAIIHQDIGELYSIRHVERLMHKLGFSLITPRTMHVKHDQDAVDIFRTEFKKNSNRGIWVMN